MGKVSEFFILVNYCTYPVDSVYRGLGGLLLRVHPHSKTPDIMGNVDSTDPEETWIQQSTAEDLLKASFEELKELCPTEPYSY